jgi:hypothetical protein
MIFQRPKKKDWAQKPTQKDGEADWIQREKEPCVPAKPGGFLT